MKRLHLLLLPVLIALAAGPARAQTSAGNYRIPYVNGILAAVLEDHDSHSLSNRVDLQGIDSSTTVYFILAAEAGTVRYIKDNSPGPCTTCTNYVWIEHANGEWTGYFYLQNGSVTTNAGLQVGDPVSAGQIIGIEGNRGSPSGPRLRFEVGVPTDSNDPIVVTTGMLKGASRIPIICNVPDNVLRKGVNYSAWTCFAQEFSYGTYRMPYTNNVQFLVFNDHLTHTPNRTRYDLVAKSGYPAPFPVVAAASGTIMTIVDNNTTNCGAACQGFNNYVWIRHSNGEWTKYTHFAPNTVLGKAGLTNGQFVTAGTYLGDEGQIGAASIGVHLHFEVGVPTNGELYTNAFQPDLTNAFQVAGGFIFGINRIPIICGLPGNIMIQNQNLTAANCANGGCTNNIALSSRFIRGVEAHVAASTVDTDNHTITVDTYGSLALLAGNKVTLRPGFRAASKSYLRAALQPCFNPP